MTENPGKRNRYPKRAGEYFSFFIFILLAVAFIAPSGGEDLVNNISVEGTETLLSTATWGTDEIHPAVWEDCVVWQSSYPSPQDPEVYFSDIFWYNTSSGEMTRITDDATSNIQPDIWGDFIVWSKWEEDNYEIHLHNLSTNEDTRITTDFVDQVKPRIWRNYIVWLEGFDPEWNVYVYDIATGLTEMLGDGSGMTQSPDIWEDRVVWEDGRNGFDFDIYLYNITTGEELQITSDPGWQTYPSVWEDRIVWQDFRDPDPFQQICLYDLGSGNETRVTFGDYEHTAPRLSGNSLVYLNMTDINLLNFEDMTASVISHGASDFSRYELDLYGNRCVWSDNRIGDFNVFLFTPGISLSPLNADFSQNVTQGRSPLEVSFQDNSSGQIAGWQWDFGDGENSVEKSPIHNYENNGSYSVTLTIFNPWQRDAYRKNDLISVGDVPGPDFSLDLASGPAPLEVAFTDSSSGEPHTWRWDFGDGSSSAEQNPTHIYQQSGVYNVCLTAGNIFGNASVTKHSLITVMKSIHYTGILPSEGITLTEMDNSSYILVDLNQTEDWTFSLENNNSVLNCSAEDGGSIKQVLFYSDELNGFSFNNNTSISGILKGVTIVSDDLGPLNFNQKSGEMCYLNFSVDFQQYHPGDSFESIIWEGCTPDDLREFNRAAVPRDFEGVKDVAYSVMFDIRNTSLTSPATLTFAVSSDWVQTYGWGDHRALEITSTPTGAAVYVDNQYRGLTAITVEGLSPGPHKIRLHKANYVDYEYTEVIRDERDSIHVIRIGDDGNGEVLNTTFIGHDPDRNLDLFRAESPNGLSTFGLASLSKSGNIFQLILLLGARIIAPSGGGGGGGSSDDGGSTAAKSSATATATSTPTSAATPKATALPTQIPSTSFETKTTGITQPEVTPSLGETGTQPAPGQEGPPWIGIFPTAISSLSIVFVVIFVTIVFYYRWKRKED